MATKKVQDFFKNKVIIKLKTGHQFQGLLSKIDNKNGIIIMEDIQDLGNVHDKELLPLDKKIVQKAFEAQNIAEIILNDKVFVDPKKYKRDDFFDSMTEHKESKYRDKAQQRDQRQYKPNRGYRGGRGGFGGYNSQYRDKKYTEGRPKKSYEAKEQRRQQQDDERSYR